MLTANVQKAIYENLIADATLMAMIVDVYDNVPQAASSGNNSKFPYVTISDVTTLAADTNTTIGNEILYDIHTFSRKPAKLESYNIQNQIVNILNRAVLTVDDAEFITCDFTESRTFLEPDGKTNRGVLSFRILVDEV